VTVQHSRRNYLKTCRQVCKSMGSTARQLHPCLQRPLGGLCHLAVHASTECFVPLREKAGGAKYLYAGQARCARVF